MTIFALLLSGWVTNHAPEILAVLGYLLTLAFIPVVLIRKRQPSAALAWCLAIILLPYLGTFLFLLIGVPKVDRKLRKKQFHRSRFIRQWIDSTADQAHHPHPPEHPVESHGWAGMDRLAAIVGAVKVSGKNDTTLYHEGTSAFRDKMDAIRDAKHHVHAEYYILRADHTGRAFVDLLCDKAAEGLEIRLLVDAIGSRSAKKLLKKLRRAGGKAELFLPMRPWRRRFVVNLRNHRKILICDGKVAFTGGLNIGDEYLGRSKRFGFWRDTQMRILGPAVLALQRVFVEDWDFSSGEFLSGAKYFPNPAATGEERLQIVWSGPDHDYNAVREVYFAAVTQAQDRLWITTPYFVPGEAFFSGLKSAALRGVDVRILTQSSPPDQWIAYFAARYYWRELLEYGVRIFQYTKGMIHAKVVLADGAWASVGSANMDIRSLNLNFEVNCLIHSKPLIEKLEAQFMADLDVAEEVLLDDLRKRPLRFQLAENVCRLLSPIL